MSITDQIKTKHYWLSVASFFIWFLFIYTLVTYFFREPEENFWSLKEVQSRSSFAFFMAVVFAYWHREQPKTSAFTNTPIEKQHWTMKDFIGIFCLLLLFSLVAMSVLFCLGWLIMYVVNKNVEPVGNSFIKMLLVTIVLTALSVLMMFLADRFGISIKRQT